MRKFLFAALLLALAPNPSHSAPAAPEGLRGKAPRVEQLKRELKEEFGIEALDKTDTHSPRVLANLLFLLRKGIPASKRAGQGHWKFLFAYAGHDDRYDRGAYHAQARAISVGGRMTYPGESEEADAQILSTLAHELGHAYLFAKVSPSRLRGLAEKHGGWDKQARAPASVESLTDEAFLAPHPAPEKASMPSRLAAKNMHEWFADSFAASVLLGMGEQGLLGKGWEGRLVESAGRRSKSWVDYNRVALGFRDWMRVGE